MKRIISIAPRKLKKTQKETKQIIHQITESTDVKPKTNKRKKDKCGNIGLFYVKWCSRKRVE